MPGSQDKVKHRPKFEVLINNTAAAMISSLFAKRPTKVKAAIKTITADIGDPDKVKKLDGYENVYVARGHGMRVIFKIEAGHAVIASVSAES